jgi:cardiolipin synthase
VKAWIQPEDGVAPVVNAIDRANKSIQIFIFRSDRPEIELALAKAVERGVAVHALIAYTNRGGERHLRDLELRLLKAGATVARSADDLARYHGKMLIVDKRLLYVFAFNFTYLDMERSRSFAILTKNPKIVQEAINLFDADTKRQPYKSRHDNFVVSPVNSRKQLSAFIKAAKKELLVYDPKVSDPAMVRLLAESAAAGVEVKIIGRLTRKAEGVQSLAPPMRLHARVMLRDQQYGFIGSQSLRKLELDGRREVGLIFRDHKSVGRFRNTFMADWEAAATAKLSIKDGLPVDKAAKKVAEQVADGIAPVAPTLEKAIEKVVGKKSGLSVDAKQVEETIKEIVVKTVRDVVQDAVQELAANGNGVESK